MGTFLLSLVLLSPPDSAWTRVMQLSPGVDVRILSSGGAFYRGAFARADDRTVVIVVATREVPVGRDEVQRVLLNRGTHHRKRNAVVGLLAGGLIGAAVHQAGCAQEGPACSEGTPAGFYPGAIAGAIAGAALPSGDWEEIYRSRR